MSRSAAQRGLSALVSTAAVVAAVCLWAAPAAAHTVMLTASPMAGSSGAAPREVRLTFDEPLEDVPGTALMLSGPSGLLSAAPVVVDGASVRRALPAGQPAGAYTVAYRVVSRDGHPVSGTYRFDLTGPSAGSSDSVSPPSTGPAPSSTPVAAANSAGTPAAVWLVLGGLALAAVAGGAMMLRRSTESRT